MNNTEKNIEKYFLSLYNNCYTKYKGIYLEFYYDENYILKEKIYRIKGGKKPEKSFNVDYLIFEDNEEY